MKILMCVDFMTAMGRTIEQEYSLIEKEFIQKIFPTATISFERDILPQDLSNRTFELYVFDYGGLFPGADILLSSLMRELERQIEDHPNSFFIFWTEMTIKEYAKFIEQELDDVGKLLNVTVRDYEDEWIKKVLDWFKEGSE